MALSQGHIFKVCMKDPKNEEESVFKTNEYFRQAIVRTLKIGEKLNYSKFTFALEKLCHANFIGKFNLFLRCDRRLV